MWFQQFRDAASAAAATMAAMILCLALDPAQLAPTGFGPDGEKYLQMARYLLAHGALYGEPHSMFQLVQADAWVPNTVSPPVYFPFLALALSIWNSWRTALALNAVIFGLTCWIGLKLLNRLKLGTPRNRFLFLLLMVLDPAYLIYNGGVQMDTLAGLACCAFVLAWYWASQSFRPDIAPSTWRFVAVGIIAGLAVLTRGNLVVPLAVFALITLARDIQRLNWKKLTAIALAAIIALTIIGGWTWRNYQLTGIVYPTGAGGVLGYALADNYSLGGSKFAPQLVWSNADRTRYARELVNNGTPPLKADAITDKELQRRVVKYVADNPGVLAKMFSRNMARTFLASMYDEPDLIAKAIERNGINFGVRPAAALLTFGARGLILFSFMLFPLLAWYRRDFRTLLPIWGGSLSFVILNALLIRGGDRFRVPIEPFCVMFLMAGVVFLYDRVRRQAHE